MVNTLMSTNEIHPRPTAPSTVIHVLLGPCNRSREFVLPGHQIGSIPENLRRMWTRGRFLGQWICSWTTISLSIASELPSNMVYKYESPISASNKNGLVMKMATNQLTIEKGAASGNYWVRVSSIFATWWFMVGNEHSDDYPDLLPWMVPCKVRLLKTRTPLVAPLISGAPLVPWVCLIETV